MNKNKKNNIFIFLCLDEKKNNINKNMKEIIFIYLVLLNNERNENIMC